MEDNIADALKMAGSVLLFVIGLSIVFVAFSQARETMDIILSYSDRESVTVENDERFYYLNNNETTRYVGKETIIPTLYRAYKENFKIIFDFKNYYLFKKDNVEIKTIDLEKQSIANDFASRRFLEGIVYGKFDNTETEIEETQSDFEKEFNIKIDTECLFNFISSIESNKRIKEDLGTYYIEEVGGTTDNVENINKTEKRVITYSLI